MKVITIKFENSAEWNFLLNLLKRLNLRFEWREEDAPANKKVNPSPDIVSDLFGSFHSELPPEQFVKSLYDARVNQTREISL